MLIVGDHLISEDIKDVKFACDLCACKGACCIEGDAGAPISEDEINILEDCVDTVFPYMRKEGIEAVKNQGVFVYDVDGETVTPLINGEECAFVIFDDKGTALCAIEKAFIDKKIKFQKPISCHLYPIRVSKYSRYEAVNYHRWEICDAALKKGQSEDVPLYKFLELPLKKAFGNKWYSELKTQILET